jgi:MFS family permease
VTTAVIGGAFSATSAFLGIVFGTFVDRHRKKTIMLASTTTSLSCYTLATVIYVLVDRDDLLRLTNPAFWVFIFAILACWVADSGTTSAHPRRNRPDDRHTGQHQTPETKPLSPTLSPGVNTCTRRALDAGR